MIQFNLFHEFYCFEQKTEEQAEKINDMIGVMGKAIKLDDMCVQKEIELFSKMVTENRVKLNSTQSFVFVVSSCYVFYRV